MSDAEYFVALNADPGFEPGGPRSAEIGETFADALTLLKRAKYVALAVSHGAGPDWSYVRVPRAAAVRWINARIGRSPLPAPPLYSKLTALYDEELWLFIGSPLDHAPASAGGLPS